MRESLCCLGHLHPVYVKKGITRGKVMPFSIKMIVDCNNPGRNAAGGLPDECPCGIHAAGPEVALASAPAAYMPRAPESPFPYEK